MKNCKTIVYLILVQFFTFGNLSAQTKTYLSGTYANTAIDWEFKMSEGRNSGYWTTIPVPSNWETKGFGYYTYGKDHKDYKTKPEIGYYRYNFKFNLKSDKRYFIVFQGAMTETTVTLNGKQVGDTHIGGFTEFKYEVTDFLKSGDNLLEVEVLKPATHPQVVKAERIADYWLFGGIFRPVYIEELPVNCIDRVAIDAQMNGDFKMDVFTDISEEKLSIEAQVYDGNHQKIGKPFTGKIVNNRSHLSATFKEIELWSHEYPNLYSVDVSLNQKKKTLHTYKQKFGFRTFEVRDYDGFYLNGKRVLFKGANMHSFRPETGRTLTKQDMLDNIKLMQDMNFNTVRICHYPPDAEFLDLCDSLGLMAMDELPGWRHPHPDDIGEKIVKELVIRDVNHPSVVFWSNGNHLAHKPKFDEEFFKWDIQKRRPLKNETKTGDIYKDYSPNFDIVKTNFYPGYDLLKQRLFEENHIVLPNEALHALYDGGGGANLKTYWDAIEMSKVGGGLMIWALFDEGLRRTDMNNQPFNQGNNAPDGIVGPNSEKEGSFYAVREIWSPVIIEEDEITSNFNGELTIQNKFDFVNLKECEIRWKLIAFETPNTSASGYRTVVSNKIVSPDVAANTTGQIRIDLPQNQPKFDALVIEVFDNKGLLVYEKRLMLEKESVFFQTSKSNTVAQDENNPFLFYLGSTTVLFDENSGVLKKVAIKGKETSIKNFPFINLKRADTLKVEHIVLEEQKASVKKENENFIIVNHNSNGFDTIKWTIKPSGELRLDYKYTPQEGAYEYVGVGMEINSHEVKGKRWLGEGPARIWKNRTQGGIYDVYAVDKLINIPGQVYNQPEFEGCFGPWKWAEFHMENNLSIGFQNNSNVILGVLNPVNGKDSKMAAWEYPKKEGFYFFNGIPAVGSKWKKPTEFGPDAQPYIVKESQTGSVSLFINWNNVKSNNKTFKISIE
ncbi:glycoside hydrolase family 2 TIM barrel-domain containing protein [Seonamhaeicola maritimus]|uniref:glycoside hydrolase family 2 TIM barrel-domain containing protein n=1 Tax=Seonamhaeicola maritimus TaxID=2591822 RepID=UPI0024959BAD|nr:glycoside hydrolase family 2 TIM barrel-domain containing protein [Seonamhaeicola maritimus]